MPITDKGKVVVSRNPGVTAYEIAVLNGFVGTESQWLASLVGQPSYNVYTALISQSGTDAPAVLVLENTLSAPIVWTRVDTGIYAGTLTGEFTSGKTFTIIDNSGTVQPLPLFFSTEFRKMAPISQNIIHILTGDSGNYLDNLLSFTPIEIRVYP